MKLCLLIKYPPIQGGVSAQGFWAARALAARGHEVHVVTHAEEVEAAYRLALDEDDRALLEPRFERGSVRLHGTEPMSRKLAHIPQSNPFVSKLAGRAAEIVRRYGCELIFSYYFEPFGVAGHLAKCWTGVPQVIRHAGSDLGRLMLHPDLASTYAEILRRADGIISGNPHPFVALGVPASHVHGVAPYYLPVEHFRPDTPPLDVAAALARVSPSVVSPLPFDASKPAIGIYGKVGEQKGSFDLVRALSIVKRRGASFNFVALTQGTQLEAFREAVAIAGLDDRTYILPFVAHWKVGQFIRACTAVCFLERDFTISFHTPSVPKEVLSSATCLVLSGEILEKQAYKDQMVDGENYLAVPDPRDVEQLADTLERVVRDPERAREIGRRGGAVAFRTSSADELGKAYEETFEQVLRRHRQRSVEALQTPRSAASRAADLGALLPQLASFMGAAFEALALAYAEECPAPQGANADAEAFLTFVERSQAHVDSNVLSFSRHLLWMGRAAPGEDIARPFGDRSDELPRRRGRSDLAGLAPLKSELARVVTFASLSESLVLRRGAESPPRRCAVLFNKQANFLGHYFVIGDWMARLLESCDGTHTVDELAARYAQEGKGRSAEAAREAVVSALQMLYRNRAIIFVAPARR